MGRQGWGGGGGGGLLVYVYTTEGLAYLPGLGATHTNCSWTHVQRRAGRKAAPSGRQSCCWHNEGVREVAAAPTAATQRGGSGKLHRKSEGVGGGVTNQ